MNKSILSSIAAHVLWLLNWLTVNGTIRNAVLCLRKKPSLFTRGFSDLWNIASAAAAIVSLFVCGHEIILIWLAWYRCGAIIVSQGSVLMNTDFYVYGLKTSDKTNDSRRLLLVGLLHYAEVVLWFAVIYRFNACHFTSGNDIVPLANSWGSLYYSMVTITTLGYGEIRPNGVVGARLVILELAAGVFMTLVVLARFVSLATNSRRQEFGGQCT